MIVVSNTSPIIALSAIGQIELLRKLYEKILIPDAVFHEISIDDLPGCNEISSHNWFMKNTITKNAKAATLSLELDTGEAEAIALALEVNADLLLIDERKGKAIADRLSINNIGVLGILIEAKHDKLIDSVKPCLDDLINTAGFWFDKKLYDFVLIDMFLKAAKQ